MKKLTTMGERLDFALRFRGYSQSQFARMLGIRQPSLHKIINGVADENKHLPKAADLLEIDLDWLRKGIGPAPSASTKTKKPALGLERATDGNVLEIDVEASAGDGSFVDFPIESHPWVFPETWLRSQLNAKPADLRILTIKGDSGESDPPRPTDVMPGDKVIVNIRDKKPSPPGMFVVWDGTSFVAKRVEIIVENNTSRLRLSSNNNRYSSYDVSIDDAKIQGRILAKFQRIG